MRLNWLERLFILSPIRSILQDRLEARQLFQLGGPLPRSRVLEVGCGAGHGIDILFSRFAVSQVEAFDLDPLMVSRAYRRQRACHRQPGLWVGTVRHIPVRAHRYDAVFNYGAIHHVVEWRAAVAEIHRVLRPGGRFYCEEILKYYITHPIIGKMMDHPQQDRFDAPMFIDALQRAGFHVDGSRQMANLYLWVVATKPAAV